MGEGTLRRGFVRVRDRGATVALGMGVPDWASSRSSFKGLSRTRILGTSPFRSWSGRGHVPEVWSSGAGAWWCCTGWGRREEGWGIREARDREPQLGPMAELLLPPGSPLLLGPPRPLAPTWFRWYSMGEVSAEKTTRGKWCYII